jgi:hypothetical protein
VNVKKVGEAVPPPQKRIGDKVEPLTELLVVTVVPKSTYNNLNPDHAKKDPAVTDKVVLEKEALDGGVITKDDVTMKTVIEADPPSREVGDKVEPLTESLVVIADPQSTQNNLSSDHAKIDPAVTENVELKKDAVDSGIITKDGVNMKTVVDADPPSRELGDKVEPLEKSLVVTADPQSTQNNLSSDHAKMDPAVAENVELEKDAVDSGIITKDGLNIKQW